MSLKFAITSIVIILTSPAVYASDNYEAPYTDTQYYNALPIWTGIYAGVHGGYGWADWDGDLSSTTFVEAPAYAFTPANRELSADDWVAGITIGANHQIGALVLGVETDVSGGGVKQRSSFINDNDSFRWDVGTELKWFGTARARAGYATGSFLFYTTAGFAWAKTKADLAVVNISEGCVTCPVLTATGSADESHIGWTIGGGFEWQVVSGWTFKTEYLYADLGKADYHLAGTVAANGDPYVSDSYPADLAIHTVRIGVNRRF